MTCRTYFQVMTSAAHVRGKARRFGRYRNAAVVEIDPTRLPEGANMPRMISPRARGIVRIVCHSGPVSAKATRPSGAWPSVLLKYQALADKLNASERQPVASAYNQWAGEVALLDEQVPVLPVLPAQLVE